MPFYHTNKATWISSTEELAGRLHHMNRMFLVVHGSKSKMLKMYLILVWDWIFLWLSRVSRAHVWSEYILSFEWFSVSNQTSHSPALRKTNKATAKTTDFLDTHTNMHTHKNKQYKILHTYTFALKKRSRKRRNRY